MPDSKNAIVARLDPEHRTRTRQLLEKRGFAVREAEDGVKALKLAREASPDLVFADGILTKMSGFELCREVKSLDGTHDVTVVLVLEENDSYGRGRARAEGADLVVTEPVIEDDLDELLSGASSGPETDAVIGGSSGARDRFIKELLRGQPSKNDPFVSRISDPLTGLNHKDYISLKLEEEFKKARRYGNPLSILLVDVEDYEEIARTHGKPVAHEILLEVAGIFLCESRDIDSAGRVGEARFLLLLPSTDLAGARVMADRVFQQVCGRKVRAGSNDLAIRVSVGIAALPSDDVSTVADFVERALKGLRAARGMGGNRICSWTDGAHAGDKS